MAATASASYDYRGATVLVTGGVRGVGLGISRRFLAAGARVVACARRQPDQIPTVGTEQAEVLLADVRDPDQVDLLISTVVDRFGRLDVVVNNAGGAPAAPAATASPRLHARVIELNLVAPLHVAQRANLVMQQQDQGGSIVMIGSVSGTRPSPGTAAYGAAKAGLENLARSLAVEWAPKVRVNTVTVGLVKTEQSHLHYGDTEGLAAVASTVPLGRMASPEDVGDACLFLASTAASYISGANLLVHGGGEAPAFLAASTADQPVTSTGRTAS
jgi:NAD(P)-dependent dehydrogenase (short-subunit alcohol dehydrogenase family)